MIRQERSCWRWLKVFFFHSVFYTWSCACKRSWKLNRSMSLPAETPLFHRKHCSCNISSVVQPVILSLSDITVHHCVTHFHNLCLTASLACKSRFHEAAQLLLVVLAQGCVSWSEQTGYLGRGRFHCFNRDMWQQYIQCCVFNKKKQKTLTCVSKAPHNQQQQKT